MHKEELISLHKMLYEVKDYFEEVNPDLKFSQYNALKITPSQLHKSKLEHKYAIFVLGNEIANAMKDVDYTSSSRISARMKDLADKTLKEMEYA
jgi:Predicted metal-binding protein